MSEQTALAVVPVEERSENAGALMRQATDVAGVCREIVMRTAMELQGRKYVKVEGWMSIAAAYGCVPSIREVVDVPEGIKAVAELRKHDGTVLAAAEGFVGMDEPRWANQPLYARRGMAQTRAVSRVCRSVFAFVVTLIDSNLQTTPAEEIPSSGEVFDAPAPAKRAVPSGPVATRDASTKIPYGKSKGKYLCDVDDGDLAWLLTAAQKSADGNDPKWHTKNVAWLESVRAEQARRAPASGKVTAPTEESPRQLRMDEPSEGEEIVTPTQRLFRLRTKYGLTVAKFASICKGATSGKDGNYTHEDLDRIEGSLSAMANALGVK